MGKKIEKGAVKEVERYIIGNKEKIVIAVVQRWKSDGQYPSILKLVALVLWTVNVASHAAACNCRLPTLLHLEKSSGCGH